VKNKINKNFMIFKKGSANKIKKYCRRMYIATDKSL